MQGHISLPTLHPSARSTPSHISQFRWMSHNRALRPAWPTYTTNGSLRKTAMWLTLAQGKGRQVRFWSAARLRSPVHPSSAWLSLWRPSSFPERGLILLHQAESHPTLASWARSCRMNLGSCLPPPPPSSLQARGGSWLLIYRPFAVTEPWCAEMPGRTPYFSTLPADGSPWARTHPAKARVGEGHLGGSIH